MAGAAVIGALRVVLGADTAALEKGLKGAQGDLASFGAGMARVGAVVGAAMVGMLGGIGVAVKGAINEADNLGKMAQKIGIPVEELSALKHAADLSDVSMETLSKAAGKLSKNMVEAVAKPTSEASNAFRSLGVSVRNSDGTLKSSSTVMADIAGKFEGIKDGAGKTAISMALFGRAGAELIPLLNAGRTGLTEMTDEAAKLGIVITTQTAKSAEAFNDNLTRLGKVKEGIIMQLTARMLPALEGLSQKLINAAKESDVVNRVSSVLVKVFEGFARGVMLVADNFGILARIAAVFVGIQIASAAMGAVGAMVSLARAVQAAGLMTAAFNLVSGLGVKKILLLAGVAAIATGQFDTMVAKLGEVASRVEQALPEGMGDAARSAVKALGFDLSALDVELQKTGNSGAGAAKGLRDVNIAALGGKNALDQYIASVQKSIAGQNAEAATFGMTAGAKERLKVVTQGLQVAQAAGMPVTAAMKLQLDALGLSAQNAALKMAGLQLTQDVMTEGELFQQTLDKNRQLFDAGAISAETYARAQEMAASRANNTWAQAGTSMAGSFQKISQSFGKENSAMATAAKIFGGVQAVISMYTGAANALVLPFPANLAAMAAVLATGAGLVASINSQSVPGYAMGADFRVPGGIGGGDKVPVSFMAEPGERVQVQSNRTGGQSGEVKVIEVRGWGPEQILNHAGGRSLIDAISAAISDGYRIKFSPA